MTDIQRQILRRCLDLSYYKRVKPYRNFLATKPECKNYKDVLELTKGGWMSKLDVSNGFTWYQVTEKGQELFKEELEERIMKPSEVLQEFGWSRTGHDKERYCMLQAIAKSDYNFKRGTDLMCGLQKLINGSVIQWNDNICKDQDEAIRMMQAAEKEVGL